MRIKKLSVKIVVTMTVLDGSTCLSLSTPGTLYQSDLSSLIGVPLGLLKLTTPVCCRPRPLIPPSLLFVSQHRSRMYRISVRPRSGLGEAKITCDQLLVGLNLEPGSIVTCTANYTVSNNARQSVARWDHPGRNLAV